MRMNFLDEMFFLNSVQYETRTRLDRFSGSSSISSADLFDDPKKQAGEKKQPKK